MIKRYNQFINKINEADEVQAPVQPDVKPETAPAPTTTPDRRRERYTIPTPSVNPDPLASGSGEEGVEDNLEYLQDTLEGSQLMNNILKYQGHEITLPSETGEFEVDGVRNIKQEGSKLVPTSSAEDVIEYLNNPEAQAQAQAKQERRLQAQAQRAQAQVQKQAQVEESVDYTIGRTENQLPNPPEEIELNISTMSLNLRATGWLTQEKIAMLFGGDRLMITKHLKHILKVRN